jgi:hypothetical protein
MGHTLELANLKKGLREGAWCSVNTLIRKIYYVGTREGPPELICPLPYMFERLLC